VLKNKKRVIFISLFTTVVIAFIPFMGIRIEKNYEFTYYFFGFPAQWLGYYGDVEFSFAPLGFLFNFAIFYVLFVFLKKISNKKAC